MKCKDFQRLLKKIEFSENAKLKDVVKVMETYIEMEGENEKEIKGT